MSVVQTVSMLLELKDKISGELDKVNKRMAGLNGAAGQTQSSFASFGIAGLGAVAGIAAAAYRAVDAVGQLSNEGIDLNRQFERTQTRIAGTLQAFNVAPSFAKAKAEAAGVMRTIEDLAAKLPGETEDYVSVFATALPKAISAGMTDMQEVAKFTSQWTAIATANMVDANQAGMDLFRMLSGQAGADVRMFTVLAELIGMNAETFNKLSAPERLAAIVGTLGKFNDGLTDAGEHWDSVEGEFESRWKRIKKIGTENAFALAKNNLKEMNEELKKTEGSLIRATYAVTSTFEWYKGGVESISQMLMKAGANFVNLLTMTPHERAQMYFEERKAGMLKEGPYMDKLRKQAAEQEASEEAREARRALYKERGFEEITKMLPPKLAAPLGPSGGIITPKLYDELLKIGKARRKDVTFVNKLTDFVEFMGGYDAELMYYKIRGIRPEGMKKEKLATAKAPNFDFRNSRFDIKQQFAEGFDPDRIAVAFATNVANMGEARVQAAYTPVAAMR